MIKIIDNFLDKEVNKKIYNTLTGDKFNWHICKEMVHGDDSNWFFYHTGIEHGKVATSEFVFANIFLPVINSVHYCRFMPSKYKLTQPNERCYRAKINYYPLNEKFKKSMWHKDFDYEHMVAIYYINSNNGYTELKDKGKIESVENRLVIFSGDIEHRAIGHTDTNARLNINLNYIIGKEI